MAEPITAAIGAGYALLEALWNVKEVCLRKLNNDELVGELSVFITNLNLDLVSLTQRSPRSNSALWAAGALKEDLDRATEYLRECLDRGYIKSIWSVRTIHDKLRRVRKGLATSFQTKLQIIIFDVVIEEQSKQEEFRAYLSRVQRALTYALADSAVVQKEWKDEMHQFNANILDLRTGLNALLQPVLDGVAARPLQDRNMDLDTAIALTRSTEPQTPESEKFFADVLANLEGRRERKLEEGHISVQDDAEEGHISVQDDAEEGHPSAQDIDAEDRWFEDPITAELMCDPVKCSDGRTYDRWTVIDKHMVESPFDKSLPEFGIVLDDVNVRAQLFRMFPKQEASFRTRRLRHRQEALAHASKGEYGDALEKLDRVLQWARSDQECITKRDEVRLLLQGLPILVPGRHYPNESVQAGKRRGLALIFSREEDVPGGAVDRGSLGALLKTLKFETDIVVDDLENFKQCLREAVKTPHLADDDCFLCCITAHGGLDDHGRQYILAGARREKLDVVQDILKPITECRYLANKPKVFVIVASRGTGRLSRGKIQDAESRNDVLITSKRIGEVRPLLTVKDSLVVFSSSLGEHSYTDSENGSNFITEFMEAMAKSSQTADVLSIFTDVIRAVTEMKVWEGSHGKRYQCPELYSSLTRRLYWS